MFDKEEVKQKIRGGVATVVFTKKDGTQRTMKCTLSEQLIPAEQKPKQTETVKRSDDALPVFDIDKQEWRSFRYDALISVS